MIEAVANPEAEKEAEDKRKREAAELATKWLKEIGRRRTKEKTWRDKARKTISRYRDDREALDESQAKFNILWANTEVLKPAIFVRMPIADVRRRYLTRDPVARTASMIMERALTYSMDSYDFKDTLDRALEDYLLPGRGQVIICYKPYFQEVRKDVSPLPDTGEEKKYPEGTLFDDQATMAGPHQMQQDKLYEEVYCEYQPWDAYVFGEATQRFKVPWEAYGDRLSKDEVKREYPDFDCDKITFSRQQNDDDSEDMDSQVPKVMRWKVWHRPSRKLITLFETYKEAPVAVQDDPLGLENFFPSPDPLYALRTNGDDTPKPEYLMYQDQAIELDILVDRQRRLTQQLKYRGLYDKMLDTEEAKLSDITKAADGVFLPVPNYNQLAQKGGLEGLLDTLPLEEIAQVLGWLTGRIELLKQEIYEVYGISDIVRGSTKASETLGAQQMKAQYAGMRISTRQNRFQRFIRDILRIKAEIMAEHFSPETLQIMTGIDVMPDAQYQQMKAESALPANTVSQSEFMAACQLIKSDKLRGFRIDIETDSTTPVDRDTEQQNRVAFITAVGTYLQGILPFVESGAIPIKLAREGLLFVVRGFKVGTELEEVLEELGENADEATQMQQLKSQLQQCQAELAECQQENQELKADARVKMQTAQVDSQIKTAEAGQDMQITQAKATQDMAIDRAKASVQNQITRSKPRPVQ